MKVGLEEIMQNLECHVNRFINYCFFLVSVSENGLPCYRLVCVCSRVHSCVWVCVNIVGAGRFCCPRRFEKSCGGPCKQGVIVENLLYSSEL